MGRSSQGRSHLCAHLGSKGHILLPLDVRRVIVSVYDLVVKRHLLFGREAITNLDSILKSRHITLPTKVQIVQAMILPVVMYRYESWTINKAEW